MSSHEVVANVLVGALALLSLVLTVLAGRAWLYARDSRSLLLLAGFALLLVKAVVLLVGLFRFDDWTTLLPAAVAFDLGLALAFYVASVR